MGSPLPYSSSSLIRNSTEDVMPSKNAISAHICREVRLRSLGYRNSSTNAMATQVDNENSEKSDVASRHNVNDIIYNLSKSSKWVKLGEWDPNVTRSAYEAYIEALEYYEGEGRSIEKDDDVQKLYSSEVATYAAYTLTRMKIPTKELSWRIRALEKILGSSRGESELDSANATKFTYALSLALLRANGKAGNVARTLDILKLRGEHNYRPNQREFTFAIQSIVTHGNLLRTSAPSPVKDSMVGTGNTVDNPTKWLDMILINMFERGFKLNIELANMMLDAYTATGRTGRAEHYFYQIVAATDDEKNENGPNIKMEWNNNLSLPQHKIPSSYSGNERAKRTRFFKECKRDWSLQLTSAFEFARSLTHGACGHPPIKMNLQSWNILIKVCIYRGALWRANHVLKVEIPRHNLQPDTVSYNTVRLQYIVEIYHTP